MNYIRFAINNPVKVTVGVLLVLLGGFIALIVIPIQLVPNIDQPVITIQTSWTGRSPEEIEREVIEEQEDKIKGVSNLRKMVSTAQVGSGSIELEFYVGTDMTRALQEVSDKLREVPSYPADVDQPVITVADSASENAIAWMVLTCDDPSISIATLYDEADKRIKPYLERVEGLAQVNIYGGREREVHVQVNPQRLAERGITFNQLRNALRQENVNVSAGDLAEGRLDIRVRTVGQYDNIEDVKNTIIVYSSAAGGGPVRVGDVADVVLTYEKRRSFVHSRGQEALAINAIRQSGSNVVAVMQALRERIGHVNTVILPQIAPGLTLTQVYDETVYIDDALNLVTENLWQGGVLCILVLLFFLRSFKSPLLLSFAVAALLGFTAMALMTAGGMKTAALIGIAVCVLIILLDSPPTAIIALAIPVSVIGTFVVLTAFGRNLNVVSIAGLAFAVGMVVDNSIVVLENIDRHLSMGKTPLGAAFDATREVWGAVLVATATTLVVFLPVLTIKEEAGQLFLDISLAICAAVALSLTVAITVIPTAAARWLHVKDARTREKHRIFESVFGLAPLLGHFVHSFADFIYWLCRQPLLGSAWRRLLSLVAVIVVVLGVVVILIFGGDLTAFKADLASVMTVLLNLQLLLVGLLVVGVMTYSRLFSRQWHDEKAGAFYFILGFFVVWCLVALALTVRVWQPQTFPGFWAVITGHPMIFLGILTLLVGIALLPIRLAVVGLFTVASIGGAYLLMPPTTYLPKGNRNLVFGFVLKPPGYNIEQNLSIADRVETKLRPYWEATSREELTNLPPAIDLFSGQPVTNIPPIENFFFVTFRDNIFMGGASREKQVVAPLGGLLRSTSFEIPGAMVVAEQISLFGRGLGGTNSIEVELTGSNLDDLRRSASALNLELLGRYGFGKVFPTPRNFELAVPELQVQIDRVRASDLGIDVASLGLGVQALIDGVIVGDFRLGGDSVNLLMGRDPAYRLSSDDLGRVPVAVSADQGGGIVPLGAVADIRFTEAPQEIRRIEQLRAITLTVTVGGGMPLEQATEEIRQIVAPLRASGAIAPGVEVTPAGTADKLVQIRESFLGQWHGWSLDTLKSLIMSRMFLALLVNYLVMAWLFNSFLYPFVIMFSVPLATIGGFLGLRLAHEFDPTQLLDVVTMLGFVILIGVVVNNAILLVSQALNFMRGFDASEQDKLAVSLPPREAIRESVRTRMRPVLMTTITTISGMLPLVIKPGEGSELYRGLGSVVLGGLLFAGVFTLMVVPLTFSIMLDMRQATARFLGRTVEFGSAPAPATPSDG